MVFIKFYIIYFIIAFLLTLIIAGYKPRKSRISSNLLIDPEISFNLNTLVEERSSAKETFTCSPPIGVSGILYHGTSQLTSADDILFNNKFLIKNNYPQGVYLSDRFDTASTYALLNGYVVVISNNILPWYTIDINDVFRDPRYTDWTNRHGHSGDSLSRFIFEVLDKRLVRQTKDVFVAVIPYYNKGKYYRIEGLKPLQILDRNRNIIKSLTEH